MCGLRRPAGEAHRDGAGVEKARVSFAASTLLVQHQGDNQAILNAIHGMGYKGQIDHGQHSRPGPGSFWKSNKYVFPTAISLVMLVLGLLAFRAPVPE